jgi:hypothetical protein
MQVTKMNGYYSCTSWFVSATSLEQWATEATHLFRLNTIFVLTFVVNKKHVAQVINTSDHALTIMRIIESKVQTQIRKE